MVERAKVTGHEFEKKQADPWGTRVIRVLHLVHAFQTGGAERVVLDLIRHSSRSIENYVCSLCEPNELASHLDADRVGFKCLHKREGNDLHVITAIAKLIDEQRIDVVHGLGWGTFLEGLVAAKLFAKRHPAFVFAFHGKNMEDVANGIPLRRRIAQRIAQRFCDGCVAPASHMADDYARTVGMRRDRIKVIYNGVDLDQFGQADRRESRAALGLGLDEFVVGFVGRLEPVKDIGGLVDVFARFSQKLESKRQRVRLVIVGDGTEREAAERAIVECGLSGHVLLAGRRSDIPECMAAMDVYIQPSHYEGHSLSLLEAMASGLPVISTAVGGTPEIINSDSVGFLYPPGDYEQMALGLLKLYRERDLRTSMAYGGRDRVAEHFSIHLMATQYEELFRKVARNAEYACVP